MSDRGYTYHGGFLADQKYEGEYQQWNSDDITGSNGGPRRAQAMAYYSNQMESPEEIAKKLRSQHYFTKDATIAYLDLNKSKMERGYKVLKLQDLASELKLPSSKGMKTKDYLALIINEVENKGLRFVQFLQLVDVLYVIIQKVEHAQQKVQHVTLPPEKFRPQEEIQRHYGYGDPVLDSQLEESTAEVQERTPVTEEPPELENVKKRDHLKKEMDKVKKLPWQK